MSAKRYEDDPDDLIPSSPVSHGIEAGATPSSAPQQLGFGVKGLRGKMFGLFFLIPLALILTSSSLYIWQLTTLSSHLAAGGTEMVSKMSEDVLTRRAQGVASQVQVYLATHPELKKPMFNYDINFKSIAVQKVGAKDYTALYEKPGPDGIWRTWAHVNPDIIGIDMTLLKKSLGESFEGFWKIYTGIKDKAESKGYYEWRDTDGVMRKKFMVVAPVTGTPYALAATAYVDEFTNPVRWMQDNATQFATRTRNIVIGILTVTLILIGVIVAVYGYRLTERITHLTDIADRISVGDMDAEIAGLKTQDEIGELARAISRMQGSIRLAIKRLKERERR
jgi:HAMP domain-containing protein